MTTLLRARGRHGRDEGSIVMAMLAILAMTGIVTVGLATVVTSHLAARHDVAFESSLAGAERGLDELIAQVKANPAAASFLPLNGTTSQGVAYSATAVASGAGSWTVTSTGTSSGQGRTVTRRIQATVNVGSLLSVPLFGQTGVSLGGSGAAGSAVDRYDSTVSSSVCTTSGDHWSMTDADTRMCHEASPALGAVATDGTLTLRSADLDHVSEADIYNYPVTGYPDPDATGKCGGDATVCGSIGSRVLTHNDKVTFPLSTACANGIGGGVTALTASSTPLAANAVYSFTDVTLNATAIANLGNIPGSQIIICFNGTLNLPPTLPLNATIDSASSEGSGSLTISPGGVVTDLSAVGSANLMPRPPSTLVLISTSNGTSAPVVNFGMGSTQETAVSAVIYAPNATCGGSGHVDVYGLVVCGSVAAPAGLDVHYDANIANMAFDRAVTVSHWREL